ncbi:MAG: hypothetical protein ACRDOA_15910 [Streptosporangiaceae bacterium]
MTSNIDVDKVDALLLDMVQKLPGFGAPLQDGGVGSDGTDVAAKMYRRI